MDIEAVLTVLFFTLVLPMSWMYGVTYFKKWRQQQVHTALGGEAEEQILRLQERLAELEERVDFTERLLARGPDQVKSGEER